MYRGWKLKLIVEYKPYYSSLQECGTVLLGAWFPAFLSIVIPTSSMVKHFKKILFFKASSRST
jgi:hypothetical protein